MSIASQVGRNTFRINSYGPVVEAIQLGLKQCGYALTGTGYFGPATDAAVEAFQRRAGLTVDGVVGNKTASAIDASIGKPLPAPASEIGRPLWLEAGLKLIGTKEAPGKANNPVIINWAKDEGEDSYIAKNYKEDSTAWCSLFVGHCMTLAGIKGTGTLWALDWSGKWPATNLGAPAVGSVAPMLRNGGGHVIIVAGRDQHGNIMGLGGNQRDSVCIEPFPMSRLNKGFWWPQGVTLPAKTGFASLPVVRSDGRVSSNEA